MTADSSPLLQHLSNRLQRILYSRPHA